MKLLHTSDWHVGKTLRGDSRLDEHRAVLAEIADDRGRRDAVDVVLVTGDLFESGRPAARRATGRVGCAPRVCAATRRAGRRHRR